MAASSRCAGICWRRGGVGEGRQARDLAPQIAVIRNNLLLALMVGGRRAEAEAGLRRIGDEALRSKLAAEAARIGKGG